MNNRNKNQEEHRFFIFSNKNSTWWPNFGWPRFVFLYNIVIFRFFEAFDFLTASSRSNFRFSANYKNKMKNSI